MLKYETAEKYKKLRIKYFSDPNYKNLSDTKSGLDNIGSLYEFNFLSDLLHSTWGGEFENTSYRMHNTIKNHKKYPQINWRAYIDYIDEVRKTLPIRNQYETQIYDAVDNIRSEFELLNNQQVWL